MGKVRIESETLKVMAEKWVREGRCLPRNKEEERVANRASRMILGFSDELIRHWWTATNPLEWGFITDNLKPIQLAYFLDRYFLKYTHQDGRYNILWTIKPKAYAKALSEQFFASNRVAAILNHMYELGILNDTPREPMVSWIIWFFDKEWAAQVLSSRHLSLEEVYQILAPYGRIPSEGIMRNNLCVGNKIKRPEWFCTIFQKMPLARAVALLKKFRCSHSSWFLVPDVLNYKGIPTERAAALLAHPKYTVYDCVHFFRHQTDTQRAAEILQLMPKRKAAKILANDEIIEIDTFGKKPRTSTILEAMDAAKAEAISQLMSKRRLRGLLRV